MSDDIVFIVADECFALAESTSELSNNIGQKLAVQLRGARVSPVIATQRVSALDPALKSSLAILCSMRGQAEELRAVAVLQDLLPEQRKRIFGLDTGEGVVTVAGRLPNPVVVRTEKYKHDVTGVSDAEIDEISRRSVQDLMARVRKVPSAARPEATKREADRLSRDAEKLLETYERMPLPLRFIGELLGWAPPKLSRVAKDILKLGIWLEAPSILGHGNKYYELTDAGKRYCERHRIRRRRSEKGSPGHHVMNNTGKFVIAQQFGHRAKFQPSRTAFETESGQRQPDGFVTIRPHGVRIALQAAFHNSPACEAEALAALASLDHGPDFTLCVAQNKAHMLAIRSHVDRLLNERAEGMEEVARVKDKIKLMHFDELLNHPDLSWMEGTSLFEDSNGPGGHT